MVLALHERHVLAASAATYVVVATSSLLLEVADGRDEVAAIPPGDDTVWLRRVAAEDAGNRSVVSNAPMSSLIDKVSGYIGCFEENSGLYFRQSSPQWCVAMSECVCAATYKYVGYTSGDLTSKRAEWSCFHSLPTKAALGCKMVGDWHVGGDGWLISIYKNPSYPQESSVDSATSILSPRSTPTTSTTSGQPRPRASTLESLFGFGKAPEATADASAAAPEERKDGGSVTTTRTIVEAIDHLNPPKATNAETDGLFGSKAATAPRRRRTSESSFTSRSKTAYDEASASSFTPSSKAAHDETSASGFKSRSKTAYDEASASSFTPRSRTAHDETSASSLTSRSKAAYDEASSSSFTPRSRTAHDETSASSFTSRSKTAYDEASASSFTPRSRTAHDETSASSLTSRSKAAYDEASASSFTPRSRTAHDETSASSFTSRSKTAYDEASASSFAPRSRTAHDETSASSLTSRSKTAYDESLASSFTPRSRTAHDETSASSFTSRSKTAYDEPSARSFTSRSRTPYDEASASSYTSRSKTPYDGDFESRRRTSQASHTSRSGTPYNEDVASRPLPRQPQATSSLSELWRPTTTSVPVISSAAEVQNRIPTVHEAFHAMDTKKDGVVDIHEGLAAGHTVQDFKDADVNGDGHVDADEFAAAAARKQVQASFDHLDSKKDGVVDMEEAKAAGNTAEDFKEADLNGDGYVENRSEVDSKEFAASVARNQVQELFDRMDTNKDGVIDKSEARAADFTTSEFRDIDTKRDGKIDNDEFTTAVAQQEVQDTFDSIDTKKDGVVDIHEAKAAGFTEDDFKAADQKGDGVVDSKEFATAASDLAWIEKVQATFRRMDLNNDGYVDLREAKAAGFTEEEFKAADTNHDGRLDSKEFAVSAAESDWLDRIQGAFDQLDKKKDGVVDMTEAKAAGLTEAEFKAADANGDGVVDKKEFAAAAADLAKEEEPVIDETESPEEPFESLLRKGKSPEESFGSLFSKAGASAADESDEFPIHSTRSSTQPRRRSARPAYREREPSYRERDSSYREREPSYRDREESSYREREPSYRDRESSYGFRSHRSPSTTRGFAVDFNKRRKDSFSRRHGFSVSSSLMPMPEPSDDDEAASWLPTIAFALMASALAGTWGYYYRRKKSAPSYDGLVEMATRYGKGHYVPPSLNI